MLTTKSKKKPTSFQETKKGVLNETLKARSKEQKVQEQKNKVRLFDILTRVVLISETYNSLLTWNFEFALPLVGGYGSTRQPKLPGIVVNLPPDDARYDDREPAEIALRIDSADWEFKVLEDALDKLDAEHREEQEKQRRKHSVLRRMSEEEREALGYVNWKDPYPDDAAADLAEATFKVQVRKTKRLRGIND